MQRMIQWLSRSYTKSANNIALIAVRRGLTYMIPALMAGSIALLLKSLPIPAYQQFMERLLGSEWTHLFEYMRDGTFGILSLIMVICISYAYIGEKLSVGDTDVSPIVGVMISLGSFVAISGMSEQGFSISHFGVIGMFIAIVVSVASSAIFIKLSSVRWLKIKVLSNGANSIFSHSLRSLIPAAITIAFFALINFLLVSLLGVNNIQTLISDLFVNIFANIKSPFLAGILFVFSVHLLWFFGMHGSNILEPVAQSVFVPALLTNQVLMSDGQAATEIFSKTFIDVFVLMGGCGAVWCLILAMLLSGKYKNQLQLVKISAAPVLFNINELMVFGLPIVLNPVYIIPFIFVPVLLAAISSLAVSIGLVPYTSFSVEWTTPVLLSGYVATQSISGLLLQVFNLMVGTLCYLPFVNFAHSAAKKQGKENLRKVFQTYRQYEERGQTTALLARSDESGNLSRLLASDLAYDLQNNRVSMFYQPQVNHDGVVTGVEALLRWNHSYYGYINPPLTIALAEESGIIEQLGFYIFETACAQIAKMQTAGIKNVSMSVNVSALQLEDEGFAQKVQSIAQKHGVSAADIEIEITEQVALARRSIIIEQIKSVKQKGFKLVMDDFGKGHNSLINIKEYDFDKIKVDGSLVLELLTNSNCRKIISSIIYLGRSMQCDVIAEYVETQAQRDALYQLGCTCYQGYLFSKPVPANDVIEYIQNIEKARMHDQIKSGHRLGNDFR